MGKVSRSRVGILVFLLILSAAAVNMKPAATTCKVKAPLDEAVCLSSDWVRGETIPIDPAEIEGLKVDDYVSRVFINGGRTLSLYIGYYRSGNETPHSPLICYPGAGWFILKQRVVPLQAGDRSVQATSMIVQKGRTKELVVYWFQAFDRTFPGNLSQRLYALWCKFNNMGTETALVEILIDLDDKSESEALSVAAGFVEAFYPLFVKYITGS